MIRAEFEPTFVGWRREARKLMLARVPPAAIDWSGEGGTLSLFAAEEAPPARAEKISVPIDFMKLAEVVSCARDADRWSLLYRILYRLRETPRLLDHLTDPDIHRARLIEKSVRRDEHKMHAFVRFKKVVTGDEERYLAWHQPEHLIVRLAAPFFERRFGDRRWSIFTPDLSAHWDLRALSYGPGLPQHEFPHDDAMDDLWKTYYASTFNPARVKLKMMRSEMSPKYWKSMPETALIRELVREAPARLEKMARNQNSQALVPATGDPTALREAALGCAACPIGQAATRLVFGEGPPDARVMIVGEQPGDYEDLAGRPFVGPAGELLDECLRAAGLERRALYLTNAVKHFKWKHGADSGGKIRIHQKPSGPEAHACRPWLEAEIALVKPRIIIALGATAGTSILGRLPKITEERGKIFRNHFAEKIILSWHPAAILRSRDAEETMLRKIQLTQDLALAASR